MPRVAPVLLQVGDEAGHQHDVDVPAAADLVGDAQPIAVRIVHRLERLTEFWAHTWAELTSQPAQ